MIQTTLIQLAPADIYGLNAMPNLVLPAPPMGYVNNILGISHDMVFNSVAYTGATNMRYGVYIGDAVFIEFNILSATSNYSSPISKNDGAQTVFSTTKDLFLTTDAVAADGDSNINAYIIYEQIQLT